MHMWKIQPDVNVGRFNANQAQYLEFHRNNIFLK